MTGLTGDQADALSRARARTNLHRLRFVFGFTVAAFLLIAYLLQVQQHRLAREVERNRLNAVAMCENRRANTIRVNATWDQLARIDARNTSLPSAVRAERVAAYQNAKLEVATCTP